MAGLDSWSRNGMGEFGPGAAGALSGLRVLEFGQYVAGPIVGMLLADEGAAVVKVERPGGDPGRRSPSFVAWNRGKRSLELDLREEENVARVDQLVANCDVVINNLSPDATDKLRIGYERLAGLNPGLIYCSLPGFASSTGLPAELSWDPLIMTMLGFETSVSYSEGRQPGAEYPVHTPLPIPSVMAGITAAGGIVAALLARDACGVGQRIEVPLHTASLIVLSLASMQINGELGARAFTLPIAGRYRCRDGRYIQTQGLGDHFVRDFVSALGHPEWVEEASAAFRAGRIDESGFQLWNTRFSTEFGKRTAQEWESHLTGAGLVGTVVRSIEEWFSSTHARAAGLLVEIEEEGGLGLVTESGRAVSISSVEHGLLSRAPRLGEHNETVLPGREGCHESASDREERVSDGARSASAKVDPAVVRLPLDGVRVLDLCTVLAGPAAGRALSEFGADVIKVDSPRGPGGPTMSYDVNRGKRSMILDLATKRDRDLLWELVADADVFLENSPDESLGDPKYGFSYAAMVERNPDIVYASLNCFGYGGPWTARRGYEQNVQAATGIQMRRGGRGDPPQILTYPVHDYATGLLGAYAVLLGIRERNRTGRPQRVTTSLVQAAGLVQSPYVIDYPGYRRNEPEGMALLGESALSRLYQSREGEWLYLHISSEEMWYRLVTIPAFEALGKDARFTDVGARMSNDQMLADELAKIFGSEPRHRWLEEARAARVGVAARLSPAEYVRDLSEAELTITQTSPEGDVVEYVTTQVPTMSRTPKRLGSLVGALGGDTEAIVNEVATGPTR